MAKLTALEFVQRTLSAIDEVEVDSINDDVISEQVFLLLKSCYEELINDYPWYHLREYGNLEVTTTANKMKIPDNVLTIDGELIRYNKKDVYYISPEEMNFKLDGRDTTLSNVDSNGAFNDKDPVYWTSEDDTYVVFDSYDSSLVSSLSRVRFIITPSDLTGDLSIPSLPDRLHTVLLYRLYEDAFRTLKGDEQTATRYGLKYKEGLFKAKRWARKLDREASTHTQNYARVGKSKSFYITSRYLNG